MIDTLRLLLCAIGMHVVLVVHSCILATNFGCVQAVDITAAASAHASTQHVVSLCAACNASSDRLLTYAVRVTCCPWWILR